MRRTGWSDEEILKMYKLRCSSYIAKRVNFEHFLRVVQSLADYWFTVAMLPAASDAIEAKAMASVIKVG
jgi:hypothetical protein